MVLTILWDKLGTANQLDIVVVDEWRKAVVVIDVEEIPRAEK